VRITQCILDHRARRVAVPLGEPKQREPRLRLATARVRLGEHRAGSVEIARAQVDLTELVERLAGDVGEEGRELVGGAARLAFRVRQRAAQPE
jgi:hypothetical protein